MKLISTVTAFVLCILASTTWAADASRSASSAEPVRLLRHPAYSKGRVAFSYLGDIWIASETGADPRRLTDNVARDAYPRFSPDGEWIAFSSNREGNYDVFVVPASGGKPRRLTFNTADDIVANWTPDGRRILFLSSRNQGAFPSVTTLFEIAMDGGMETPVPTDWASSGCYSPDGSKLVFTRHPATWSRKHYRGSYAADLWVMDVAAKKFSRLGDTDFKGNCLWPMYGKNGEIYFVCDRLQDEKNIKYGGPEVMKSVNNIYKISDRGGAPIQITHHTSGNLFFPSISADGKTIVYEENFGLWKLDLASGKSTEIQVAINSDSKENEIELRTVSGDAESFSLSPSNKRAAISTHGEIFTVATDRGESQRVTETPWREQNPHWSPDGKWIAFVSDRTGREEIYLADEHGRNLKQLTDVDCDKSAFTWSPDSNSILWSGSDHKLRLVWIEKDKTDELTSSDTGPIGTPQFSPDGKWISFSKQDKLLRSHVYVKPLEGGEEHKVEGEDFLMSSGARWTPDGRKLILSGGVGAPSMSSLNRTVTQLYVVSLTHLEKNPDDKDVDTEEQATAGQTPTRRPRGNGPPVTGASSRSDSGDEEGDTPRRARTGTAAAENAAKPDVKIEWDGIERRIRQLTRMSGSIGNAAPSPDSKTIAFVGFGDTSGADTVGGGRPAIYTIADDGTKLTTVAQGAPPDPSDDTPRGRGTGGGGGFGELQWARDGRSLYYMQGGGIYSVSVSPASGGDSGATPGSAGAAGNGRRGGRGGTGAPSAPAGSGSESSSTPKRVTFTVRLEVDLAAERRQVFEEAWRVMKFRFYDPKMHGVDWAAARERYQPLLANVGDSDELHNVIMQMIGELNASHTGVTGGGRSGDSERAQTRHPGFDLEADSSGFYKVGHIYKKGPADHDYVKIKAGNFILALNGKELKTSDNYWMYFNLLPGRKFEFTVNSEPKTEGSWTVSLEPLSSTAQGDLEYERWVDSREDMVKQLSKGQIGYLHIRAMNAPSFQKFQHDLLENLDKKALIIDERFNGGGGIDQELLEILNQRVAYQSWRARDSVSVPRPFQAFFGPMAVLQNERSASNAEMFPEGFRALGLGKVIGVPTMGAVIGTGSFRLMDGSTIRTPGTGVFTSKGQSLENYGVQPDVWVDNGPEDFLGNHDRQIEKAVELLTSEMK
jgi:tricorn protease